MSLDLEGNAPVVLWIIQFWFAVLLHKSRCTENSYSRSKGDMIVKL
jgi:hypothetical protein